MATRLLYIEDEPSTRKALAYLFRHEGYEVAAYSAAEDARDPLASGNVDIAILDVRLPGRFGDDFGRELHQRWPKIPIVFLTAEADIERLKRLVPEALVIRKPVDIDVLLSLLKRHVGVRERSPESTIRTRTLHNHN